MSSDQHKTMLSEASGYVPEYSAQAHSGSQELAVHGLSSDEVAKLTAAGKVNAQNNKSSRTLWSIMRAHLFTVFNLVLGLCGLVVILYQRWADLLFLFAVVANVIIGFVQEYKAKLELDRISLLDRSPITAVRDGAMIEVPMESLVEGDVVVLKRGDQVPADAVVLTSDSLELDESLLTGENDPIPKRPGDMVLSASSVLGGTGRVLLSAVGSESRASKISDEARQFSRIQSELRDALDRVVRWITFGLAIIIPIVLWGQVRAAGGLEVVNRDGLWENVAIAVVSSVASMIPQGLALMTTLAFAAAAVALGRKHNILVQEQPAVEVLARVDTVCFDKTGTLTEGGVIFDSVRSLTTPAEAKAP
ncbi:MAG: HAD-IC family P-type ATPase, partial [Rothia dentocariosa]